MMDPTPHLIDSDEPSPFDLPLIMAIREDIAARINEFDPDVGLAGLMRRLEQDRKASSPSSSGAWRHRLEIWLRACLPPRLAWAMLAIIVVQGVALLEFAVHPPGEASPSDTYRSLSRPSQVIRLNLRPEVTSLEMQQTFARERVRVIDGPSSLGGFTVVPSDGRSPEDLLNRLRLSPVVESLALSPLDLP